MPATLNRIWTCVRDWSPYVLPAISNFILVILGVIMSLPKLADTIETTPFYRKSLAVICLVAGVTGFVFDVNQRHSTDQLNTQLLGNLGVVLQKTNDLAVNTNTLVATTGLLAPQLAAANNDLAFLKAKMKAAEDSHESQRLASLQLEMNQAQQRANEIARRLALATAPNVIRLLTEKYRKWAEEDQHVFYQYEDPRSTERDENRRKQMTIDRERAQADLQKRSIAEMEPLIDTANRVRIALLQGLTETEDDKEEAGRFADGLKGDPTFNAGKAADYLNDLLRRSVPPPSGLSATPR